MIINFEFLQKCWLGSNVLTSGKSFVTSDTHFKHFGWGLGAEKSELPSMLFYYKKCINQF